jgi:hypothetical protein
VRRNDVGSRIAQLVSPAINDRGVRFGHRREHTN